MTRELRARGLPCFLCGQPIDYELEFPDPYSFSVEHIRPYSTNEELREDPGNLTAAHLKCNQSKGSRPLPYGLGNRSEEW